MPEQEFSIAASGCARFGAAEVDDVRRRVQSALKARDLQHALKHADDQSVAALVAMLQAIGPRDLDVFRSWGVLAAPRSPGAPQLANALDQYRVDGAWGVSPHVIPHCSLHSLSGLLSTTFGLRGPNFGVGGVAGSEGEAFSVVNGLLDGDAKCGMFVVLTGWDDGVCRAVVLAMTHASGTSTDTLTIATADRNARPLAGAFSLESLYTAISRPSRVPQRYRWALPDGGQITWCRAAANLRMAA